MSQKYQNKSAKKKKAMSSFSSRNFYLLPIILVLSLVPLIVRLHSYDSKLSNFSWFTPQSDALDVFLYWKGFLFILFLCIGAVMLLYYSIISHNKIKIEWIFIPLFIYAGLALISSISSNNSYFSFHGIYEQFESVWILLGYCFITFYTFIMVKTESDVKKVLRWFILGISLLCIIGLSQAFSLDFYKTTFARFLYLPYSIFKSGQKLTFNFPNGVVYASLYNPNYVGLYTGLILPLITILFSFTKNKKSKFSYFILIIGLLICLFASQSKSGIISIFISVLFMLLLFRRYFIKKWRIFLIGFLAVVISFFALNIANKNSLINNITAALDTKTTSPALTDIQTNKDNVTIIYKDNPLIISYKLTDNTLLHFNITDSTGKVLTTTPSSDGNAFTISDNRFSDLVFGTAKMNNVLGFYVSINGHTWSFTNQTGDGSYYYYNSYGKFDKINHPAISLLLKGRESFATGRGYIWSRTIPLLKKYILLGSGADTFAIEFPNDDYVGLYNYGYSNLLISKPHCMYLQIAVQTGVFSLIALLIFYIMYFITSIKLYFKGNFDSYLSQIGIGIFLGTIGYMIACLTNDSTITVAPIFWVMMGIGISINSQLKKQS